MTVGVLVTVGVSIGGSGVRVGTIISPVSCWSGVSIGVSRWASSIGGNDFLVGRGVSGINSGGLIIKVSTYTNQSKQNTIPYLPTCHMKVFVPVLLFLGLLVLLGTLGLSWETFILLLSLVCLLRSTFFIGLDFTLPPIFLSLLYPSGIPNFTGSTAFDGSTGMSRFTRSTISIGSAI